MKRKLDPKLQLNHMLAAQEFIYKTVCITCKLKEGMCGILFTGNLVVDLDKCYKHCWHYARAVDAVTKILNKYDK